MERRREVRAARAMRWVPRLVVAGAVVLGGCSDDTTSDAGGTSATTNPASPAIPVATSPTGADDPNHPVDVIDCGGRTTTFTQRPERVVALDETIAETLVLLGERDLIVGIVRDHPDEDLWGVTQSELLSRQVVADRSAPVTREAVERVAPDLVLAADPSRLEGPAAAADRQQWADAGIASMLFRSDCEPADGDDAEADGLNRFYADLRALASALGEPVKGEKLVSQAQAAMQTLTREATDAGASDATVWVVVGDAAGPATMAHSVLEALGVQVIGAGAEPSEVAAADPDLIWLITPRGADVATAADELRSKLLADPTFASLGAVDREAFVVTAAADIAPSPRFVEGARALVDALIAR